MRTNVLVFFIPISWFGLVVVMCITIWVSDSVHLLIIGGSPFSCDKPKYYGKFGRISIFIQSLLWNHAIKVELNSHTVRSFRVNSRYIHISILRSTMFLIFKINVLNAIISDLGINVDDTCIYSSVSTKSDISEKVKLAASLKQGDNWARIGL